LDPSDLDAAEWTQHVGEGILTLGAKNLSVLRKNYELEGEKF